MYVVTTDDLSGAQVAELPTRAMASFAELWVMLEVAPWSGPSLNALKPDAPMRSAEFGPHAQGLVTYLILDDQRRVDLLTVFWVESE